MSVGSGNTILARASRFTPRSVEPILGACARAGASRRGASLTHAAPVGSVPALLDALRDAGVGVAVDQDVVAHLRRLVVEEQSALVEADEHLDAVARFAKPGLAPRGYQRIGVAFLRRVVDVTDAGSAGRLCGDEMGTGKSVMGALALDLAPSRAIVVCPASLRGTWESHIGDWRQDLKTNVIYARGGLLTALPKPGQVAICGYAGVPSPPDRPKDGIAIIDDPLREVARGTTLIIDEAHRCGNASSRQSRAVANLARHVRAKGGRVLMLTGTPLTNKPTGLWNVLEVGGIGRTVFGTAKAFKRLAKRSPDDYARRMRSVMIRRLKKDVNPELPPKQFETIKVRITEEHRRHLDALLEELRERARAVASERARREAETEGGDPDEAAARAVERVDASIDEAIRLVFESPSAVPFDLITRVKSTLAIAKIRETLKLVADLETEPDGGVHNDPLVAYSAYLPTVEALSARKGWASLTGALTGPKRDEVVKDFQAGKFRGLALTSAGGEGITLTRAWRFVRNDREWSPAANDQAVDRLHRIGQTAERVLIYDVVADHPLDERITELVAEKAAAADRHVDVAAVGRPGPTMTPAEEALAAVGEATGPF